MTYVKKKNGIWIGGWRRFNIVYLPESQEVLDLLKKHGVI